jgi:TonB family protein
METYKQERSSSKLIWVLSAFIALILLAGGAWVAKMLITGDDSKRKRHIHMVTLLKPPPPPKIKEKPPEPKLKEKEVVEEKQEIPDETPEDTDDTPAGEDLGLDADGGAGSDAFGLRAKKGGRALIGGAGSSASLLRKYAWYVQIIQDKLRKEVKRLLDERGGIPGGKLHAVVRIVLDEDGRITHFKIIGSSGNGTVDDAVKQALKVTSLDDPPPEGMPKAMKLRITSQG